MYINKLGVVIVTYNSEKWIESCLESLADSSVTTDCIVVVDNNSSDNTISCIKNHTHIKLIQLDDNSGFGVANNIGASYCIKNGCCWLLLLNPDAKVKNNSIQAALETMNTSDKIGIVGGVELDYYSDKYSRYTIMHSFLATRSESILHVNGKEGQCINGAFLLMRVSAINMIGLFDPIYHMYFEESDLFRRCRLAGWSILLNPNIKYHHYISASYDGVSDTSNYMSENKLKAMTLSESIHRLSNPERHIGVNILSLLKQLLLIIWNYKSNIDLMKQAFKVMARVPMHECLIKWKIDRSRDYKHYLEALFK